VDPLGLDALVISETFVRATGPGGQNVNKLATAVQLRVDLAASRLPPDVKRRLIALAGRRVTAAGELVIVSRAHRTQAQNRDEARVRLAALLAQAAIRPKTRTATKPRASAREQRLDSKKRQGAIKRARRRPDEE
jgi:ribosome-associated protein